MPALSGQEGGRLRIWLTNCTGKDQSPITDGFVRRVGPCWLPDGKRLLFVTHEGFENGKRRGKLCMVNVDNHEMIQTDFPWDDGQSDCRVTY